MVSNVKNEYVLFVGWVWETWERPKDDIFLRSHFDNYDPEWIKNHKSRLLMRLRSARAHFLCNGIEALDLFVDAMLRRIFLWKKQNLIRGFLIRKKTKVMWTCIKSCRKRIAHNRLWCNNGRCEEEYRFWPDFGWEKNNKRLSSLGSLYKNKYYSIALQEVQSTDN